jgi:hypothetical protein
MAPLRSIEMEADHGDDADDTTEHQQHQVPSNQADRPPTILLTSKVNWIQLQRQLKYLAIRCHFESKILPYFIFYPNFQKPIKAMIRHLSDWTPAEDISDGLVNFGFDVISAKQCPPPVYHLQKEPPQ